jgi:hypothetical protein
MPLRSKTCAGPCGQPKLLGEFWKDKQQPDGRMTRCIQCVKDSREEKRLRRDRGEVVPRYSEEEIERRRQNAQQLHAEGRLGGAKFGRLGPLKRKARVTDAVLDHFRQAGETAKVISVYDRNLRSRNPAIRQKAADKILDLELKDEEVKAKLRGAGKGPEDMTPEELEEFLVQGLAAMIERGEAPIDLPEDAVSEVAS